MVMVVKTKLLLAFFEEVLHISSALACKARVFSVEAFLESSKITISLFQSEKIKVFEIFSLFFKCSSTKLSLIKLCKENLKR